MWFQTSISNVSTLLEAKANYRHSHRSLQRETVQDAMECARVCYNAGPVCKSAVYTPDDFEVLDRKKRSDEEENVGIEEYDYNGTGLKKGGVCTLLPLAPDCNPELGLISKIAHHSIPVLLFCFSCPSTEEERLMDSISKTSAHGSNRDGKEAGNDTMANGGVISDVEKSGPRRRDKRARSDESLPKGLVNEKVQRNWQIAARDKNSLT